MIGIERVAGHTFIDTGLSSASVVIDLGANNGTFSRELNRIYGCNVIAYEPNPQLASRIRTEPGITVYEFAVAGMPGTALFQLRAENSEASAIVTSRADDVIDVEVVSLDSVIGELDHVEVLKIDIEGSEISALSTVSARQIKKVKQVTVEFHDFSPSLGVTLDMVTGVCRRMRELGFDVYKISYRTWGDVLFINRESLRLDALDRLKLHLNGRWLPGAARVFRRMLFRD